MNPRVISGFMLDAAVEGPVPVKRDPRAIYRDPRFGSGVVRRSSPESTTNTANRLEAGRTALALPESSRANADDRLPADPLGRIESGDGIVEGRDVADVRP